MYANKPFDHDLFDSVCQLTKTIAKDRGIMWEEEQAEIAYEILTNDNYASTLSDMVSRPMQETIASFSRW